MPSKYFPVGGGLDLSTAALEVNPSRLSAGLNHFASIEGGYERGAGTEVFDGRPAPSDNLYYLATFNSWDTHLTDIAIDTTITVGALTMRVLSLDVSVADTLIAVVCSITGTIPLDLDVTPLDWDGTASLISLDREAAETTAEHETNLEAAWDYSRSTITAVPGDDAYVKGILQIDDTVVAFRDTGTSPKIHYSTAAGWVEGRIGRVAEITGTTVNSVLPGETIDSGKHIVTAICEWYGADSAPVATKAWFLLTPTTAQDAPTTGSHTASGGETFTIASVIQPITAFGDYIQSENFNFLSHPEDGAAYLCDGKNLPMSYSPLYKTLLPICPNFNALADQKATRIRVRGENLIYADGDATFQVSEPGLPYNFSGLYGAAEIGVGGIVTDMELPDTDHMVVFTDKAARRLLGSDSSNYTFPIAAGNLGSIFGASQKLDDIFTLSSRGVSSLRRTDKEGGFEAGSISQAIRSLIKTMPAKFTCSVALRAKEQIRWFMSNGRFLVMTRLPGEDGYSYAFTEGDYPEFKVRGVSSELWSDGTERIFAVSTDNFVYELEKGTNLNGEELYSFMSLHHNHLRSPGRDKSFKSVFFNTAAQNPASLRFDFTINGGDKTFNSQSIDATVDATLFGDAEYGLDDFSNAGDTRSSAALKGRGYDIGFSIDHTSKFSKPYRVTGYTLRYNNLGLSVS